MRNYKMLGTVAGLGGAMIFLAGLLVSTEATLARKEDPQKETDPVKESFAKARLKADQGKLRARNTDEIRLNDGADRVEWLTRELKAIRESLAAADEQGTPAIRLAQGAQVRALERVQPEDWDLLAKELARGDDPQGFRGLMIGLVGQCRHPDAVAALLPLYDQHPVKVADALKRHAQPEAFEGLKSLYQGLEDPRRKYGLLRAMGAFEGAEAAAWLLGNLEAESDPVALRETLGLLKQFPGPKTLKAIADFVHHRAAAGGAGGLVSRGLAALNKLPGGSTRLLEIADSKESTEDLKKAALNVLAFSRSKEAVGPALSLYLKGSSDQDALERFLQRNLEESHRELVESYLAGSEDAALSSRLRGFLPGE